MTETIPEETETIAAKRARRLAQKLLLSKRVNKKPKWWSNWVSEGVIIVFVLALNLYVVYERLGTDPMQTPFSGPTLPIVAKFVSYFGVSFLKAEQIANIFFYIMFTPSLYLLIKSVTDRKLAAAFSILIASLPFYPFAGLRIVSAMDAEDAAHMASLTFIPIALLGLHTFIRKGKINNLVMASIFTTLVALTSPFGLLTYLIFAFILTFSEMLLGSGRLRLARLISVLVFSAGLSSFWYNPAFLFWLVTGPMGIDLRVTIYNLIPISFFALPILAAFGYLLFDRKPSLQSVFLASFFTIAFVILSSVGGGLFPSHPSRYAAELGLSISFLVSITFVRITDYIKTRDNKNASHLANLNINIVRYRGKIAAALVGVGVFALVSGIVLGKSNIQKDIYVLGAWTDIEKGDLWVAKDQFRGASSVVGMAMTFVSIGALGIVNKKTKSNQ